MADKTMHVIYRDIIVKMNVNTGCFFFISREPEALVKPLKSDKPEAENEYNEKIEKAKGKAVRHLFLIRHGQYFVDGATDKERTLTDLGKNGDNREIISDSRIIVSCIICSIWSLLDIGLPQGSYFIDQGKYFYFYFYFY